MKTVKCPEGFTERVMKRIQEGENKMKNKRLSAALDWCQKMKLDSKGLDLYKKKSNNNICEEFDTAVNDIYKEENLLKKQIKRQNK